jgi:hypothetical protein
LPLQGGIALAVLADGVAGEQPGLLAAGACPWRDFLGGGAVEIDGADDAGVGAFADQVADAFVFPGEHGGLGAVTMLAGAEDHVVSR